MKDEYKKIECISEMQTEYFERFCAIVDEYRSRLSDKLIKQNSAFTLHDFDHHCFDLYKIISEVLFDRDLVYKNDYGLNDKELYILNLAVLFHDIGMANSLNGTRENHSLKSAQYVDCQYNDSNSTLRKKCDLNQNELKALKEIIIAHSDIKDGSVPEDNNGLKSDRLYDYDARIGKIRTRFLAGVLRLADELDVSVERIGTGELEQAIEEEKKKYDTLKNKKDLKNSEMEELDRWKGFESSLKFWKKLHLICSVKRNENDKKTILLVVDDDYVQIKLDEGQSETVIARQLIEIQDKIDKELKNALDFSFAGDRFEYYVPVKKVIIVSKNENINKEIEKTLNVKSLDPVADYGKKKMKQRKPQKIQR